MAKRSLFVVCGRMLVGVLLIVVLAYLGIPNA
ncbi:hypothetical protein DFR24_4150 [Panacagrimonas perspica]|uniref:Uncharacterized protein n=1 Tax=Panacagrimonas perspica TaxID=381431 RepID=A0A4R7NWU6_9GAMM|nr:hypothetical protein DFR24_4150 [Panacagrimonas perspica]